MKITTQKKFLYIPIVNFSVIMFSWLLFYYKNNISKSRFIKITCKIFLFCFLVTIPRIIISKIANNLLIENISFYISVIIYMFIPSYFALKDQEKYIEEQEH